MSRSLSRNLVVATTLVAMTFIATPMANAAPSKAPAFKSPISWVEAPLLWLTGLPARAAEQLDRTVRLKGKDNTGEGLQITAYTGSCIDPDGNRVPCPGV